MHLYEINGVILYLVVNFVIDFPVHSRTDLMNWRELRSQVGRSSIGMGIESSECWLLQDL